MNRHLRRYHSVEYPNKNTCDICDYVATGPKALEQHNEATHLSKKTHKCELCDYSASRPHLLKLHKDNAHNEDVSSSKAYHCYKCNATIFGVYSKALTEHIIFGHGHRLKCEYCEYTNVRFSRVIEHEKKCVKTAKKPEKHHCLKCEFVTTSTVILGRHMNKSHAKDHGKTLTCEFCSFVASKVMQLLRHEKL